MINEEIEPINFERFILSANLTNFKNKIKEEVDHLLNL